MTRTLFEQDLESVKVRLAKMCRAVEDMIAGAAETLKTRDRERAKRIVDSDPQIDEAEMDLEKSCMRLLLREQPFARDFRAVAGILKAITDIERIGDQAADIANITLGLSENKLAAETHLEAMGALAVKMVRDSVDSFLAGDVPLADRTVAADDRMDDLFRDVRTEIVGLIKRNAEDADEAVMLLMIAKYYERIGDHAVNVCEWTDYNDSGVHRKY